MEKINFNKEKMIDVDGVPEIIFIGGGGGGGGVLKLTVEEKIKQVLRERLLHWLTFLKTVKMK